MSALASARLRYEAAALPFFLPLALLVFTASGFAGLIYESIWSHYLKLFLGHAAYAQTLVLAIFMGGMAIGAWLASRWSQRWKDLLLAYALIEAVVGLASLAFHDVFVTVTAVAFDSVIPSLGSPGAIHAFKWTLAAALILPQSILLGMTFPLMTGGVLRIRPERSGYAVAMLYFTNSLGGAIGVLTGGFYLIEAAGLPGTLAAAAVVNLSVALGACLLPRGAARPPRAAAAAAAPVPQLRLLLVVAALTGMSSFMYEIAWVRMLALVLGSSTHAFELMLSAFIFGIAFGGLWIRGRVDSAASTVRLLALVQIAMGIAALATLPVYGSSFRVMQVLLGALSLTEDGYTIFSAASHAISLAVMFPAAFCAGMTLPLITASLLRAGAGERAIGQVYGANTLGAIAGVVAAVHLGLPLLGLKGLVVAGAAIDLGLGVLLLAASAEAGRRSRAGAAAALSAVVLLGAIFGTRLDAHDMASGVYRLGVLLNKARDTVEFHADGKTATVSVTSNDGVLSLRTNGKVDAAVRVDRARPAAGDEVTMTLIGALPQFMVPGAQRVANIGFGAGVTSNVLLASPALQTLDTVEIEPAIVEAARHMRTTGDALTDPRSRLHYEDAKTYFASHPQRYDAIVSEPSNPWVSGVSSLFTTEFYRDLRRYLREGGLLFQWVQIYELSPRLYATIVMALQENFSDYEMWVANTGDMIIVAANGGRVPAVDAAAFANPKLRAHLERFQIRNRDDLLLHRLGGRAALGPYFQSQGAMANSDFFPVLDLRAPVARFTRATAYEIPGLLESPLPLLRLFEARPDQFPDPQRVSAGGRPWWNRAVLGKQAVAGRDFLRTGDRSALQSLPPAIADDLILLRASLVECRMPVHLRTLPLQLASLAGRVTPHLPRADATRLWEALERAPCAKGLPADARRWLRLHAAIAAGAPAEMAAAGKAILEADPGLAGPPLGFALGAQMTGYILTGQGGEAVTAYARRRGLDPEWRETFRYLIGQADYRRQFAN